MAARSREVRTGPLLAPAVGVLLFWMIVPLALTLWFSFQRYNLQNPLITGFAGITNYKLLLSNTRLWISILNTLVLVSSVLAITVIAGIIFAVVFDQEFPGRNIARLLVTAPFFIMPTVSALIWKNLLMHPVNGFLLLCFPLARRASCRLVRAGPDVFGDHDRRLAMDTFCHPHSCDGHAVTRSRTA